MAFVLFVYVGMAVRALVGLALLFVMFDVVAALVVFVVSVLHSVVNMFFAVHVALALLVNSVQSVLGLLFVAKGVVVVVWFRADSGPVCVWLRS